MCHKARDGAQESQHLHLQDRRHLVRIREQPVHLARGCQEVQGNPRDCSQDGQRRVSHGKQAITHVRQTVQFQS